MKGAIMQPYFFPYIGYYQLAYEVEKFVFLDDVNYIKKGYINRNSMLLGGSRHDFSLPVSKISQNRLIVEHNYIGDFSGFLRLVERAYKNAPCFSAVMPLIERVALDTELNVARKNAESITIVFDYLGLHRDFLFSSNVELPAGIKGQERILRLCQELGICKYRNAIGGKAIYSREDFSAAGIELFFVKSEIQPYFQDKHNFISHLSMIDVLMHCSKESVVAMLADYSLV